jgi:hypothetical protein
MDLLGDLLISREIQMCWEFTLAPYASWRIGFIDNPDRQIGNGLGTTLSQTRSDGSEPLSTLVVTIENTLVLYHISWIYCWQVFNNPLLTPRMLSALDGGILYTSPLPRDWYLYIVVRYITLDAE